MSQRNITNVVTAEDLTHVIDTVDVKRFKWKDYSYINQDGRDDIGMVAEDLAPQLPEFVNFDERDLPYSINYEMLSMILWQEARKQREINEQLLNRIEALEQK